MRVYLLASTPYRYLHHRFQKLADGFVGLHLPVTYVEQTYGWRAYLGGARPGLGGELRNSARHHLRALTGASGRDARSVTAPVRTGADPAGVDVIELPLVIPTNRVNLAVVERLNAAVFRSVLIERLAADSGTDRVAIIDNPLWGIALRRSDFTRVYYDCIDDVALYAGHASLDRFLEYERRLVAAADGLFATAARLEQRLKGLAPGTPVYRLPNGVEYEWFQQRVAHAPVPDDIRSIPRPIVGYMGSIADWMDEGMIGEVARRFPGVSFVFVGPVDSPARAARLTRSPNVFWLGKKEYREVPVYIGAFDVCWIPFLGGRIVEHTNPIKLYEYFALGKPTVTTVMPETETYRDGHLVYAGASPPELASAVDAALHDGDHGRRAARMAVARDHAWSKTIGRMHAIVSGRNE